MGKTVSAPSAPGAPAPSHRPQQGSGGVEAGAVAGVGSEQQGGLGLGVPEDEISSLDRARLRVECLKCALELRSASKPIRSVVAEAKDFEAYVLGEDARSEDNGATEGEPR